MMISARHFVSFLVILALSIEDVNGGLTKEKIRKMLPVDEHFTTYLDGEQQFAKCNKCGEEYKVPDSMTLAMKNHISKGCARYPSPQPFQNDQQFQFDDTMPPAADGKRTSSIWKIGLFKLSKDGQTAGCLECKKIFSSNTASLKTHLFSKKHKDSKYAEEFNQLENEASKNKPSPVWDSGLFEKVKENGEEKALCRKCNTNLSMSNFKTSSLLTHTCYKEWARSNSVGPPNLSGNISQQSLNGGQQPTFNMTSAADPFWQDLYNKSSAENGFDLNNYLAQQSTTATGNNSSNPSSSKYGMETQFQRFGIK
ncbi:hypothetical protein niasHS_015672 [Heterodera schachtii]|uniref:BED-type domain-containing protein n=1 Tax=Heterodera schachtii TaxID=97005 RepID=A0ABD2HU84_HETSC